MGLGADHLEQLKLFTHYGTEWEEWRWAMQWTQATEWHRRVLDAAMHIWVAQRIKFVVSLEARVFEQDSLRGDAWFVQAASSLSLAKHDSAYVL